MRQISTTVLASLASLAVIGGVALAILFNQSKILEHSLYPYAVILQVTPVVAIAPLLWRLDHYGIELSKNAAPLLKYAERIFSRPAYIEALTPSEKVMRK